MFKEGKIKTYDNDRGFGFIEVEEGRNVFFHIRDFPNPHIAPKIGERLKFRIVVDSGQQKADHIARLELFKQMPVNAENSDIKYVSLGNNQSNHRGFAKVITMIGLVIICVLSVLVYNKYQEYKLDQQHKLKNFNKEQQKAIADQVKVLGDLPDKVILPAKEEHRVKVNPAVNLQIQAQRSTHNFSCDGRIHCSQMHSYDEALFFLRNCPNTQMDGDHDGIPCERQFNR